MKNELRNKSLIVKVTEKEKEEIYSAAARNGETYSNFARRTLLEKARGKK